VYVASLIIFAIGQWKEAGAYNWSKISLVSSK